MLETSCMKEKTKKEVSCGDEDPAKTRGEFKDPELCSRLLTRIPIFNKIEAQLKCMGPGHRESGANPATLTRRAY